MPWPAICDLPSAVALVADFEIVPARKLPPGNRPLKTLERLLSKAGLGSRTEARRWIAAGRVSINDEVVLDPDRWVDLELDRVMFDGKPLEQEARTYVLLYKPEGYLTTYSDPEKRPTVYDLLPQRDRYLFPVGRLDIDTSGLLIMTNNAHLAERLTNPDYHVAKTYHVEVFTDLTDEQLDVLREGIELRDGRTRPAVVKRLREPDGQSIFEITITEGRNRQVRRMFEALDRKVVKLIRIAIGPVQIGDLPIGGSRQLTAEEVKALIGKHEA
jgi:pseudouridine synthase